MRLPLPIRSYRPQSSARLVNCYPEASAEQARGPVNILRAPGITAWATPGSGPIRGVHNMDETLYVVSGTELYSLASDATATLVGTIAGTDRCEMANNGTQLAILSGSNYYVSDGATVSTISDPDFPGAISVDFLDSYLVFVEPNSGRFFCSDLLDATAYDALDFATAEGAPDNLVGLIVSNRQIVLAGRRSMEIWYNAGTTGFPFERLPSGFLDIGCVSGKTLANLDNTVFWLASDYTVRALRGDTPMRVSQHGIEEQIRQIASDGYATDAFGMAYTQNGHLFYVLTFPTANRTFTYDVTTQEWHERETYACGRWAVNDIADCYGRLFVGDYRSDKVGYLDPDCYEEWADTQVMAWTYESVYAERRYALHSRLEVGIRTGVGLLAGQGSDPKIMLEVSDDGGKTFAFAPDRSLGLIGEYRDRVVWHRLGQSADRVYRCSVSDPVPVFVFDTQIEVEGGRV